MDDFDFGNYFLEFEHTNKNNIYDRLIGVETHTGIVRMNQYELWCYEDGNLHRDIGPAIVSCFSMEWWHKGLLHRIDGPAIHKKYGKTAYYIHGRTLSKEQWLSHPEVIKFKLSKILEGE